MSGGLGRCRTHLTVTERPRPSEAGRAAGRIGGATGGGLARGARGKGRAEVPATAGEDAMAGMIYSLREFRRYTDALAVVTAVR